MHWILLVLLAILWGPSFLIIKIGLETIPPLTLAAGRVTIAAAMIYLFMRMRGTRFPRNIGFWKKFAVMGLLANVIPFSLLMIGETLATSALAAIFNGAVPVATVVIANFAIPEEKLTGKTLIGAFLGLAGILLLFLPVLLEREGPSDTETLLGMLAFAGMSLGYGFSIVYSRKRLRGYPSLVGPTAQLISASVMLIPIALIFEWNRIALPSVDSAISLIWLAVVATAIAYVVYYRLIELAGATFLSLVTFLLPPIGVVLGLIFLNESVDWSGYAACILILAAILFVRGSSKSRPSA